MARKSVMGVDIGGTKTLCILFDGDFRPLKEIKFKTGPAEGKTRFLKKLKESLQSLQKHSKKLKLKLIGVGLACAGRVCSKGQVIEAAPNIIFLEQVNLAGFVQRNLKVPAVLGNDVQLGLYGEHAFGALRKHQHAMAVFFGTGVGGAALVNGRLYTGATGCAGQVGCLLTQNIGGPETLESHGILDRMASKSAIGGAALAMGAKQWAPHLYQAVGTDLSKITWGVLAQSIKDGDKGIEDLIKARLKVVGIALSGVVNFLSPEVLLLGGGLTEEMPTLVREEVLRGLNEYLVPEVKKSLKVKVAQLKNKAGAYGAAVMAFEKYTHTR